MPSIRFSLTQSTLPLHTGSFQISEFSTFSPEDSCQRCGGDGLADVSASIGAWSAWKPRCSVS